MSGETSMSRPWAKLAILATIVAGLVGAFSMPLAAQYGGQAGLFVRISPTDPSRADFYGLGCNGGEEVVLYMPDLAPTPDDPASATSVPGRVLAVTTARSSADPDLDGTFRFDDVLLPRDVAAGTYEVHARCGSLDLFVLLELGPGGVISVPAPPADGPVGPLAFTGRESSRWITYGMILVGAGGLFVSVSRRHGESEDTSA